jgi:hypothetical protein
MDDDSPVTLRIGHEELVIRQRYETLSTANDVLIAIWFLAGSVLFFWEATMTTATWCFVLGSLQFLVRPALRLSRQLHLKRIGGSQQLGSAQDY